MPYCENCGGGLVLSDDSIVYVCVDCWHLFDRYSLKPVPMTCQYCPERVFSWCNFLQGYQDEHDRSHECIELSRYVPQQYLPDQMEELLKQIRGYPKSFYDVDGRLFVSCWECTHGYFGKDQGKCHYGDGTKAQPHLGCWMGTLDPEIDRDTLRSLPRVIMHQPGHTDICDDGTPCRGQDRCAGFEECQRKVLR